MYDEGMTVHGDGDGGGPVERVFVPDEAEGPLDLVMLERRILSMRPDADPQTAAALIARVNAVVEMAQRLKKLTWEQVLGWVRANGPLQVGPSRYYVGDKTVTECVDITKAVNLILEACGGDLDQFCKCLASRPLKHGWCRGVLKGKWGEVFRVRVMRELTEDGTPRKYLKVDNGFGAARHGDASSEWEADSPEA